MVTTANKVEWTVVQTEVEALQLEYSWIKEYDPRFNVKYRDDKSYPWLAVTLSEEFPRVTVGRGAKRKGNRYFGPYSHAWAIRETVDQLLHVFPMRSCRSGVFRNHQLLGRPCLLGYIDKCSAPCVGKVSPEEHREIVDDFCQFMGGQATPMIRSIERKMRAASDEMDFERAARLRDDAQAMQRALERNAVVFTDGTDADVIALAEDPLEVAVQIFHVRGGRIRGERGWVADRFDEGGTPELVEQFLLQLYAEADDEPDPRDAVPREILVPELPTSLDSLTELLTERRGSHVGIRVPQRGDKRTLMETVAKNADEALIRHKTTRASDLSTRNRALEEIQEALELPGRPAADRVLRHLQPAGDRGRGLDGRLRGRAAAQERVPPLRHPRRRGPERRRLHARGHHPTVPPDDRRPQGGHRRDRRGRRRGPAAHRPGDGRAAPVRVRARSWSSSTAARRRSPPPRRRWTSSASTTWPSAAWPSASRRSGCPTPPCPVILPRTSEGLYLLQRVRDEAHRFAITHHRGRRSKSMVESVLDQVSGLGEVRRRTLLNHFGSLRKLRAATVEEIAAVPGFGTKTALAVKIALDAKPAGEAIDMATGEVLAER